MQTLDQNMQKMYFANEGDYNYIVDDAGNYVIDENESYIVDSEVLESREPIYETDSEGNIIYTTIDGVDYPAIISEKVIYGMPNHFEANISANSRETKIAEYGLNPSDYDAVIVADKGKFPFTERTLIWHTSKPVYDDKGRIKPESADYRVVAIKTSLNHDRFILKKRVDDD